MVGAGCLFILVLAAAWWFNRRDTLERKRWMLWVLLLCMPLAYLASQAGWIVAEVGRQPWAIQDLMPVGVAASRQRLGRHDLLHLPGALHRTARGRNQHSLQTNQDRT